jgi:peptidyl-prolyl cis-trans isomerase D
MFQFLQSHLKKIFIVLLFFIIPSFCLYFVRGNTRQSEVVGEVFGEPVTDIQLQQAYGAVYLEAMMRYGPYFKQLAPYLNLEQQAWNRIIMLEKADEARIDVSREELRREIMNFYRSLTRSKDFDRKAYEMLVTQQLRMSVKTFEEMIEKTVMIRKLRDRVTRDVGVSDEEVRRFFLEENNRLQFSYVKVEARDFEKDVEVDETALERFFRKDPERFTIPERVRLNYVLIPFDDFKDEAAVTDAELEEYYEENKERYKIRVADENAGSSANEEALRESYRPFEDVRDTIRSIVTRRKIERECETFVDALYREMVEKNDFRGAVDSRGLEVRTTGWFSKNDPPGEIGPPMSSQVRDAFQLAENDYCGPYEVEPGWIILQVDGRKPQKVPEVLEEVRDTVERAYRAHHAPEIARKEAAALRQKVLAQLEQKTFEQAALDLGYKTYLSGMLSIRSQNVQGLGAEPDVVEAAFALREDEVSGVIAASQGTVFVFLQVSKREKADLEAFAEQKERYREKALSEKKNRVASKWLEKLQQQANVRVRMAAPVNPA